MKIETNTYTVSIHSVKESIKRKLKSVSRDPITEPKGGLLSLLALQGAAESGQLHPDTRG